MRQRTLKRPGAVIAALALALGSTVCPALGTDRDACQGVVASQQSPFDVPRSNDAWFVVDVGPGLDTPCTFRSGGPLTIKIPVDRYVGITDAIGDDSWGYLLEATDLINAGFMGAEAELHISAYDVDFNGGGCAQPERDQVFFNSKTVRNDKDPAGQIINTYLVGDNGQWEHNVFRFPIGRVKFPSRRGDVNLGERPPSADNTVTINIDTKNTDECWCTAIDWVALHIQVMSPIVLIHGNSQQGDFWAEKEDPPDPDYYHPFAEYFENVPVIYDNSINLSRNEEPPYGNQSRKLHAWQIHQQLRQVVRSLGVDSVHLVAHSKGGLDAREYLATHYKEQTDFDVLSLTTLSTPHEGAVGADYVEHARLAANPRVTPYKGVAAGVDLATVAMAYLASLFPNPAHKDMITYTFPEDKDAKLGEIPGAPGFAAWNVDALPHEVMYNRIGADADTDGGGIDNYTEWRALTRDDEGLRKLADMSEETARVAVDNSYKLLRTYRTAPFKKVGNEYHLDPVEYGTRPNDCAVAIRSAFACDLMPSFHRVAQASGGCSKMFTGSAGRNHSTVADSGVAELVVEWLRCDEVARGALRGLKSCGYGWCDIDAKNVVVNCGIPPP